MKKKTSLKYSTSKNLIFSIIIDVIGIGTYILPFLGEIFDIIWAPISAILVLLIYNNKPAAVINFIEEIIPFTDIIPTATITWFYYKHKEK